MSIPPVVVNVAIAAASDPARVVRVGVTAVDYALKVKTAYDKGQAVVQAEEARQGKTGHYNYKHN